MSARFLRISLCIFAGGFQVGGRAVRDKIAGGAFMIADVGKTCAPYAARAANAS
jgi:hypothetical protein